MKKSKRNPPPSCATCVLEIRKKICLTEEGTGSKGCPTLTQKEVLIEANKEYEVPEIGELAHQASVQEAECYANRHQRPYVMQPAKTRIIEICEFAKKMGYKRLGLVFCIGLANEASVVDDIFRIHGFEVVSVICKAGRTSKDIIGIDTQSADTGITMFGFRNEKWKEWQTPWGQIVLVAENFQTNTDTQGNILIYPQGDLMVPASAKMPRASYFFDAIIRQKPIDDSELNPADNLEEFGALSDEDVESWKAVIDNYRECTRALVANIGGTALGDIALVPAVNLKNPKGIRDISEWYMSTLIRQDYIHEVFEKQSEIAVRNMKSIVPVINDIIDVAFICGTDFGTQKSTFCSVETFRELWMPYYKKINGWIHAHTSWKTFKHCCGSIQSFIPSLIESGFDILNPVQYGAVDTVGYRPPKIRRLKRVCHHPKYHKPPPR